MSQTSSKGIVCSRVLRMATMVQASSPTTTDTVNNPRRALQGCGQGKANKCEKKLRILYQTKKLEKVETIQNCKAGQIMEREHLSTRTKLLL